MRNTLFTAAALCALSAWPVLAPASESHLALDPLAVSLRQAAQPSAFAEPLPLAVDAQREGEWLLSGDTLQWRHRIAVDGAVSLALELGALALPEGAVLTIGAQRWQGPLALPTVFTRHQPGRELALQLTLPRAAAAALQLTVREVQAGFRAPDGSDTWVAKSASACTVNAACNADPALRQWAGAVVALTVGNTATCTGTLMNNSRGDGRPFVLTARHCYFGIGSGSGSDPVRAAASLRMVWNAVAPCGSVLGSAWGAGAVITEGAVHRAEFGDAWLVELNQRPGETLAPWYAGFDARDQMPAGPLVGLHHGEGLQRQLLSTQAAPRLVRNVADFLGGIQLLGWAFAPQQGAAAPGASGSALFDGEGHVIGSLSTGIACEAGTPQVTYARLAQAWTGDGSASGSLKPWLDPIDSGALLAGKSFSAAPVAPSAPANPVPVAGSSAGGGGALAGVLLPLLLMACGRRLKAIYR